jgi:hypothetical protein
MLVNAWVEDREECNRQAQLGLSIEKSIPYCRRSFVIYGTLSMFIQTLRPPNVEIRMEAGADCDKTED